MAFTFFKNLFRGKSKTKPTPPPTQQTIPLLPPPPPVEPPTPEPEPSYQYNHNEQFLIDGNVLTMASSNVEDIAFKKNDGEPDSSTVLGTLTVRFKSGGVYEYYDVALSVVIAFVETDSPGRFVWNKLRDLYTYAKVGEAAKRPKRNVVRLINK